MVVLLVTKVVLLVTKLNGVEIEISTPAPSPL